MAPGHFHNVIFTSLPSSSSFAEGRGHRHNHSSSSTVSASALTASNATSGGHGGSAMSNAQLLGNSRRPRSSDTSINLQLHSSYTQSEHKSTTGMRTRTMRIWLYTRLGLTAVVLCWVVYCTVRYFIAVRIYRGDHIRSQYALGMGIASAFTVVFFAGETSITLRFSDNQLYRRFRIIIHSLAYLSSALVLGLTIINLVLVNVWRTPHNPAQFGRSIEGRCHWDLDVVWSGTGMTCVKGGAIPFGDWLGAAIVRLVVSAVLIIGYHLTVHGCPANRDAQQTSAKIDADMAELANSQPSNPTRRTLLSDSPARRPSLIPVAITVSEDEHQRRSLSFTAAGQVLSRIDGSELDEVDHESATSSSSNQHQRLEELIHPRNPERDSFIPPLSESPGALSPDEYLRGALNPDMSSHTSQPGSSLDSDLESGESAPDPRPSTYFRSITPPSNDLQDFASTFRDLVSRFTQEAREGSTLDTSPRPLGNTVRVLGSNISRMSTIDSMASREAGSPVRGRSGSDPLPSNGPGWRRVSKDSSMTSSRERGQDGQDELLTASPSGTGSVDGQCP